MVAATPLAFAGAAAGTLTKNDCFHFWLCYPPNWNPVAGAADDAAVVSRLSLRISWMVTVALY